MKWVLLLCYSILCVIFLLKRIKSSMCLFLKSCMFYQSCTVHPDSRPRDVIITPKPVTAYFWFPDSNILAKLALALTGRGRWKGVKHQNPHSLSNESISLTVFDLAGCGLISADCFLVQSPWLKVNVITIVLWLILWPWTIRHYWQEKSSVTILWWKHFLLIARAGLHSNYISIWPQIIADMGTSETCVYVQHLC